MNGQNRTQRGPRKLEMGYTPYSALPTTHYCNLLTNIISLLPRELTKIMTKLAPSKQEPHNSTQKKKKSFGEFLSKASQYTTHNRCAIMWNITLPRSSPPEGLPTFSSKRCRSFGLNPSGGE
jgi:hypothetical protein